MQVQVLPGSFSPVRLVYECPRILCGWPFHKLSGNRRIQAGSKGTHQIIKILNAFAGLHSFFFFALHTPCQHGSHGMVPALAQLIKHLFQDSAGIRWFLAIPGRTFCNFVSRALKPGGPHKHQFVKRGAWHPMATNCTPIWHDRIAICMVDKCTGGTIASQPYAQLSFLWSFMSYILDFRCACALTMNVNQAGSLT